MKILVSIITICFLYSIETYAQQIPETTEARIEELAENSDNEIEDEQLLHQLDHYRKKPLNLNTASAEELEQLNLLTGLQIDNLIQYRKLFGKLVDVHELQTLPGWHPELIQKLFPFVTVAEPSSIKKISALVKTGESYLQFRFNRHFENRSDNDITHFKGDQNYFLFRYRFQNHDRLCWGLLGEKDAGEQFFKGAQSNGFDFYSFHLFLREPGRIKTIALGDYTLNLGQGLLVWQSLGFGKSTEVMSIKRQSPVLLPYRSSGEYNFYRGAATTIRINKLDVTGFLSNKNENANVDDSSQTFSALDFSGYHRNENEIEKRRRLNHFSTGGNIKYQGGGVRFSLNALYSLFSLSKDKKEEPYQIYNFHGRSLFNTSIDFAFTHKNRHFFGEFALDRYHHPSLLQGILISVDPRIDLSFLFRYFGKKYQSEFGDAFSETGIPVNETGFYSAIEFRPFKGLSLKSYADHYSFPWLRYRLNAPGRGRDYMIQLLYEPGKHSSIYLRYRNEIRPLNLIEGPSAYSKERQRQQVRVHLSTELSSKVSFRTRVEMGWYERGEEDAGEGFLGYAEIIARTGNLKTGFRVQYFEIDGFNSRIYAFEQNEGGGFSIPFYIGNGLRFYFNLHLKIRSRIFLGLRLARTIFNPGPNYDPALSGSEGQPRSDLSCQIRFNF